MVSNPCRRAGGDQPTPASWNDFEEKPFAEHVLSKLEAILQEQANLRSVFQGYQQTVLQKLDDLNCPSASSTGEGPLAVLLSKGEAKQNLAVAKDGDLEEEAQKWFKQFDQDQVETLPRNDLRKLLTSWVASAKPVFKDRLQLKSEEDVDRLIEELDASGDGMIGKKEFREKLNKIRGAMPNDKDEPDPGVHSFLDAEQGRTLVEKIASSTTFDITMSLIILANMFTMLIGLQLQGLAAGGKLGLRHGNASWPAYQKLFALLDNLFSATYLLELIMRLWAHGWWYLKKFSHAVDVLIVGISCVDIFVLGPSHISFVNVSVLRVFRITRCVRIFKILRFSNTMHELRVMVDTLYLATRGVFWTIVFFGGMITAGGTFMTQLTIIILEDPDVDMDSRIWLYNYFGTVAVSMNTMFECTFSGHWWFYTRPLEDIHYLFAVFWLMWVVVVNFAAIRVIGAIFLKQTMNASAADAERCAMVQLRRKNEMYESLHKMFEAMDTSRDGAICQDEFDAMMSNKEVIDAFANMGLGVDAVTAFFSVLMSDDGKADYNEFINGAFCMATSSPTLDTLKTLHNQLKMQEDVAEIRKSVQLIKSLCQS